MGSIISRRRLVPAREAGGGQPAVYRRRSRVRGSGSRGWLKPGMAAVAAAAVAALLSPVPASAAARPITFCNS